MVQYQQETCDGKKRGNTMQQFNWQHLERLLGDQATTSVYRLEEWEQAGGGKYPEIGDAVKLPKGVGFVIQTSDTEVQVLEVGMELTPLEEALLVLLLKQKNSRNGATELERQARQLGEWIDQSASAGERHAEVPERLELRSRLADGMIPFLLLCDQAGSQMPSYADLDKALRSFMAEDTLLIPLRDQEWLILAPDHLLAEAVSEDGETEGQDDDEKAVLGSLAAGLQQMFAGEWGGDCHVAVGEPIDPVESVVHAVIILRETIVLGRKFHIGMQVHLPWFVHLERLLIGVPESVRNRFVEDMIGRPDLFSDPETLATLDAFFAMDCNVSETAKRLFIHRNTLLYRLDKIKQETGLDVRSFNDAVLVRILLLLYKVTKRK
jgi:carbohydrate diacid regulator